MEKKKFVRKQGRFVLFLMLLLLFPLGALAQQKLIKGQVVDEMGEPIIGATVMIKGVTGGTITDIDGNFSIQGKVGSTLSVTYVGHRTIHDRIIFQCGNGCRNGISFLCIHTYHHNFIQYFGIFLHHQFVTFLFGDFYL